MPIAIIDGIEYRIRQSRNMLEVALDNGLDLPYFCWHPAMHSVGACRQCAVKVFKDENDTHGRILMGCMTPATDGCRFSVNDPEAVEFRRYVIEWLMTNHPHDCPVCDEGGECHLQDMTCLTGHVYRRYRDKKRTYINQNLGPFVNHEMNRCIQCWRCVRFYKDMAGGTDLDVFGSKNRVYFGRTQEGALESEFSGNLVEVCPTGVFTDKTLKKHYNRKWDLETAPSVCAHCSLGCNTIPGARYGSLRRIRARYNPDVNGYFLCDRGRYGYEFVNSDSRIREPRPSGAMAEAKRIIASAKRVIGIGSPRASLESNFMLRKLVGEESFSTGMSAFEHDNAALALQILRDGPSRTPSLAEVQQADVIVILGADPTNEAPMLDFYIRQAVKKARLDISRNLGIPDWDVSAVANALQGAKGSLFIASPWQTKLHGIAVECVRLSYADTVAFASEISRTMAFGNSNDSPANRAAVAMKNAKQPLIITSVSAGAEVLSAAANIAWAVNNCWISIVTPEANTMGLAMMGGMDVDEALGLIESGDADTLIVLENDLHRRVPTGKLESTLGKAKNIIALDCIETNVTRRAGIVLPVSAYIESDGNFVNNECRAQRFYQVFVPKGDIKPAWLAIQDLMGSEAMLFDALVSQIAQALPQFNGIIETGLPATWRNQAGQKVARMPHRFSGRTAKDANWTIHEPRPPADPNTPLVFTMEGAQVNVPGALEPRYWYPGWNSMNSITKFQIEVNGPMHSGNTGMRLVEPSGTKPTPLSVQQDQLPVGKVWLIPRPYIFGSEELSVFTPGVVERSPSAQLIINPETATKLGLNENDEALFEYMGQEIILPVAVDSGIAADTAAVPAGLDETMQIAAPAQVSIRRAE